MLSPGLGMQGKAGQKKVSLAPRANLDDLDDLDDMLDGLGGGKKINNNQISKRVVPQDEEDLDDLWGGSKPAVVPMSQKARIPSAH